MSVITAVILQTPEAILYKNGQLKVSSHLDYYRNSETGYTPCYYKNGKKISYDAYKKAVKSFWTGKKLTFAKIN